MKRLVLGLAVALALIASPAVAHNHYREHKVVAPHWMTRVCKTNSSVNCYHRKADAFIRQFPGRAHMVCVIYVRTPRHDYCVKNHK